MIKTRHLLHVAVVWFSLVIAGTTGNGPARGQSYPGDPVEELSKALKMRVGDPMKNPEELTYRQTNLTKKLEALRTISEIHRGLALDSWLDKELIGEEDPLRPEASIDRAIRAKLVERYLGILRKALESGTATTQLAAANLIADLGTSIRAIGGTNRTGLNRLLAPDLIKLIKTGTPSVRDSAIRALANINPDPNLAVPALGELLRSTETALRRSAATGLSELMKKVSQIVSGKSSHVGGGVEAAPGDVFNMARLLIPRVAIGFADTDAVVRLESTEALYHAAVALGQLVPEPQKSLPAEELEPLRSEIERKRRELLIPFGRLLGEPANGMARVLNDSDPGTRLMARKALEAMGNARRRQERLLASFPDSNSLSSMPDDPLIKTLHATMPQLTKGVTDPDVEIRQATVDVLEMFGDASKPGVPALVQALSDSNQFVRWAAGRTLGKIGPVQEDTAVPGLAKLLEETDLDLRLTAAWALERYGPAAKAAVPALTRAVSRGDPEIRKAVMSTLIAIGKDAEPAIPAITAELANANPGVRAAAAEVLGRFGPAARTAENALKNALEDDDPEVRVAASDALLSIRTSPEK